MLWITINVYLARYSVGEKSPQGLLIVVDYSVGEAEFEM